MEVVAQVWETELPRKRVQVWSEMSYLRLLIQTHMKQLAIAYD